MAYYKITSLTTRLPKRHIKKDASLNIEYRDKFNTKKYFLPAGGTLYIAAPSLPINLHKLRMDKMISVVEIGKNTFMKLTDPTNVKKVPIKTEEVEVKEETKEKPKKRTYKKKTEDES